MTTTATPDAAELQFVPPSTLFVDGNIRKADTLDPVLVDSIREHGVLVPIVAVRNNDGGLLVRLGQRRTLAAVEAGDAPVPVFVAGPADSDEATRIVEQWAENEHRAPLTTADRVAAIEQLSLCGISADDIVKRTKASRVDVDHALAAAASKAARAAASKHTELRLDHAAAIAEFDDAPDVAKNLVELAVNDPGRFPFAAQQARSKRERDAKVRAETERLTAAGVRVIDRPEDWYYGDGPSRKTRKIDNLVAAAGGKKKLNGTTHKSCPGHAAYLDDHAGVTYVCTDWKGNGHRGKHDSETSTAAAASPEDAEKAKAERRRVIENNKAWPDAETVRREWLRSFLMSKTTVGMKGVSAYLALELAWLQQYQSAIGGRGVALDLLNPTANGTLDDAIAKASAGRADVIALGIVLAGVEAGLSRDSWRHTSSTAKRYFDFLEANGHTLSDVEVLAAGRKLGRRPTKATAK